VLVLDAHGVATPGFAEPGVLVEVGSEGSAERVEVSHVLLTDGRQGDASSGLLVDKLAKSCLAADEAVRDVLSAAEGWQMDDELDGVDVVGNDDELGLAFFNQGGHVVQTKLEQVGLGSLLLALGFSDLLEARLLILLSLGRIFGEQFKELGRYNLVINLKFGERTKYSALGAPRRITLTYLRSFL